MRIFLVLLLCLLLLLTACGGSGINDPYFVDYNVGTKGINFEFLKNSPPLDVREGQKIPIGILISNKGAHNLNQTSGLGLITWQFNDVYLAAKEGNLSQTLPVTPEQIKLQSLSLLGKSPIYPTGEIINRYLPPLTVNKISKQREKTPTDIYVSICYPYKTTLTQEVCIDTYAVDDIRTKACEVEGKTYSGQGAPVAITKLDYELLNYGAYSQPVFFMKLKNVGEGSIVSPDVVCGPLQAQNKNSWDTVKVKATLSGEHLTCTPDIVRFKDRETAISCSLDNSGFDANLNYMSNLKVELDYNYINIKSTKINILKTWEGHYFGTLYNKTDCESWQYPIGDKCVDKCVACSKGLLNCGQTFKTNNWSCIEEDILSQGDSEIGRIAYSDCIKDAGYCASGSVCCSRCEDVSYCGSYNDQADCNNNFCDVSPDCAWSERSGGYCHACGDNTGSLKCSEYEDEDTCNKNPCDYVTCYWNDDADQCYTCTNIAKTTDYKTEELCEQNPCSEKIGFDGKLIWSDINDECYKCDDISVTYTQYNNQVTEYLYSQDECTSFKDPCEFKTKENKKLTWNYFDNKCYDCSTIDYSYHLEDDCLSNPCGFSGKFYWDPIVNNIRTESQGVCMSCSTTTQCTNYSTSDLCAQDVCEIGPCKMSDSNICITAS